MSEGGGRMKGGHGGDGEGEGEEIAMVWRDG